MDKTSFLFYKATGRWEIVCVSPWDCLCQQQQIPSYGKSTAGRPEIISKRICDGCSGGTSLADTHRQLLMLPKSFRAGLAFCMSHVTGRATVPVQHPLQGSCQCWDLCFQLRTQGQAHGGRAWTFGLALGVCKDSSGALLVGQQGAAGEYTLAWGYKTVTLLHWDRCIEGDGVYVPVWEMTLENETKIIRILGQRLFFYLMSVQFLPHCWDLLMLFSLF